MGVMFMRVVKVEGGVGKENSKILLIFFDFFPPFFILPPR